MTGVDQGRIGGAGETTVVAGRDVSMTAGVITSDVNTHVAAGHNVTMKAMNAHMNWKNIVLTRVNLVADILKRLSLMTLLTHNHLWVVALKVKMFLL